MADKHTVHLRSGGKAIVDANGRVELHIGGPLVFHRKDWIHYLLPDEEARRAVSYSNAEQGIRDALAEAFTAVPMVVHRDED